MRNLGLTLVDAVSQLLESREREAVLGDLMEAGESTPRMFLGVAGLAFRRHLLLWRNWRPWLAAFGLAWPCTLLLMGFSLTVSRTWQQTIDAALLRGTGWSLPPGLSLLCWQALLLAGWSWTCGFAVGSLSRRTLWVSAALSGLPCLFCFARFNIESLSRFCLLLFLIPALWGAGQGLRLARIRPGPAILLAVSVTALTIPTWAFSGPWLPNWALSWPAWYLVATARRSGPMAG
ncbi:hypothetical protein [Paludibaculum fermentans]|uniref:Uncharacterized protein n=1 Tax=Paludibaculum fermentans TaxID=1473598 RepID=A0A7S7NQ10_PALFE|nr:hypothetical protein [Paludibaculum fermentans]QOY87671.1 hypothetical protein IRI77_33800 [Paludibaculum fermentans]